MPRRLGWWWSRSPNSNNNNNAWNVNNDGNINNNNVNNENGGVVPDFFRFLHTRVESQFDWYRLVLATASDLGAGC